MLGIAISYLSVVDTLTYNDDEERVIRIISLFAPISIYWYKYHTTGVRIETYTGPNDTIVTNLFKLFFGNEYMSKEKFTKVLNSTMVLVADITSTPFSSHVARVTVSTEADVFISAAAGLFAASGRIHGSAGYACAEMISAIKNEEDAKQFVYIINTRYQILLRINL
jgi:2-methylcitrate synthase